MSKQWLSCARNWRKGRESVENTAGLVWRSGDGFESGTVRARIKDIDSLPGPHSFYDLEYYIER